MVGFGQSAFTVVAPVPKGNVAPLEALLRRVGENARLRRQEPGVLSFENTPNLHMASMSLIPLGEKTALMFEGNIDGEVAPFLDRLAASDDLVTIFGYCEGFTKENAARYLKDHDRGIHTFYVGCPGRTLEQIRAEKAMREAMEKRLDGGPITSDELKAFARTLPGTGPYQRHPFIKNGRTVYLAGLYGIIAILIGLFVALWLAASLGLALVYLAALVLLAVAALTTLRLKETSDQPYENLVYKPLVDVCLEGEDYGINNNFCSITEIKPGLFRQLSLRYVLALVHWEGLLLENKGSLSGIPSIHFARWTILDGKWLLFLSNFDGSWESYLNDFIDKGHEGLTSVWSNTVGFPRTRFLRFEGATHEREFKVYARNSQLPTLVWYRAYDDLTTKNIDNNTMIREGLHATMTPEEDARWRARL